MKGHEEQETKGSYDEGTRIGTDNGGRVVTGKRDWIMELVIILAILIAVVLLNRVEW